MGPTCYLFFHFLVRFNSETNHFVPVAISFIIIEYSLNMYILRDFSKISFSSHYTRRLKIRKIFRLSRNLTKFNRVARFHETNLTTQSVSSSEIYRIFYYSLSHSSTITKRQNYRFALFHQNVIFISNDYNFNLFYTLNML